MFPKKKEKKSFLFWVVRGECRFRGRKVYWERCAPLIVPRVQVWRPHVAFSPFQSLRRSLVEQGGPPLQAAVALAIILFWIYCPFFLLSFQSLCCLAILFLVFFKWRRVSSSSWIFFKPVPKLIGGFKLIQFRVMLFNRIHYLVVNTLMTHRTTLGWADIKMCFDYPNLLMWRKELTDIVVFRR